MRRKNTSRLRSGEAVTGYLFFSPFLLGFLGFWIIPILYSLYLSFTSYKNFGTPEWIGLANYKFLLLKDPLLPKSLWNTFYFVFLNVPLSNMLSIFLAILLNQKVWGIRLFRTIFYVPSVVSGVAFALLFKWVLDPNFGLVNTALAYVGIEGPGWFASPEWSKPSIIFMGLWGAGQGMIIYLAGLQGISRELYEASRVDGAGKMRQFFSITIPMLSPVIFLNVLLGIIGSLQVYLPSLILTGGGPVNSTKFYAYYLYTAAFEEGRMAYASAMAWILLVITLLLTVLFLKTSKSWVYYEGGDGR